MNQSAMKCKLKLQEAETASKTRLNETSRQEQDAAMTHNDEMPTAGQDANGT
jgi:hypothetical protein